jgi:putative peptidoglycan lipid II flippase
MRPEPASRDAPIGGQGMGTAAMLLMAGTVLSRILGLVREQVNAYLFGVGDQIAAFTIADNIHTMLFDLVMSGMMQAALVPVLSQYVAQHQREELRTITGALLALTLIVVGSIVVVLQIFAPQVVSVMTALGGGEEARGVETVELTIQLVRLILPAVLLLSISTILMATLYSLQRFTRPSMSLSVRNLAIITVTLLLGRTALEVRAVVLGILLGAVLLIVIQLPALRDAMPRPNLQFNHPAIRRILWLYVPIFLGLMVNAVALAFDRNLAWGIGENALGAMRYATAMNQMILGLVAAAISLAALPTLSRHFSNGNEAAYRETLARGMRMVTVLVVPAALGLLVLSWPAVRFIFFHGATTEAGAISIWIALLAYLPGTFFAAFDQVLIFAYYARQNTRTPQIVGVFAVGVYFLFALSLVNLASSENGRMAGLVAANSAQFIFHAIVMLLLVRRLLGRKEDGSRQLLDDGQLRRTLGVCLGVGAVMALIAGGTALLLSLVIPEVASGFGQFVRDAFILGVPVVLGAVVYAAGISYFRVDEARLIQDRVLGLVRR